MAIFITTESLGLTTSDLVNGLLGSFDYGIQSAYVKPYLSTDTILVVLWLLLDHGFGLNLGIR